MFIPTSVQSQLRGRDTYLFDPIRQKWVLESPEEIVRQRFIIFLVHKRGCPPALISIEKDLKSLPHLTHKDTSQFPNRRLDIIVYTQDLKPLLLIECKAVKLTKLTQEQIIGYNHYIGAKYLTLVNQSELLTANAHQEEVLFNSHLPHYQELIN